jgi:nucleoside-diphosphate-sugar epimerase
MASAPDGSDTAVAPVRVLVTGAAGYLGTRVVRALRDAVPRAHPIGLDRLPADSGRHWIVADLTVAAARGSIDWASIDAVVHLAALTTAAAEQDFEAALALNVDASVDLMRAAAAEGALRGRALRFVFASSVGVYAGGVARVDESSPTSPASTYGFTKAVVERYVAEYARRGLLEAVALRLPVVIVRPGRTGATSAGFLSDLVRTLAQGAGFTCPLPADRRLPVASPRAAAHALAMLATLPAAEIPAPMLHLPALAASAQDAIQALRACGVVVPAGRVAVAPDARVTALVAGWPEHFGSRHPALFETLRDHSLQAIVADHLREATPAG